MRVIVAQILCRFLSFFLRIAGRGGTNLPGRVALRACPRLLDFLGNGVKVTLITGTNGKTTTSRIVEESFLAAGRTCFSNRSGANLLTGIAAVFSQNATLSGKSRFSHAVIECDEAAFKNVSRQLNIETIVVTNIFRDQLDRFGEITHTMDSIKTGITNCPNAVLCLNADCSLTVSLAEGLANKIIYFGVDRPFYEDAAIELSDAAYCIKCLGKYVYDYKTYGHMGGFRCQDCGYERPSADIAVTETYHMDSDSSEICLRIFEDSYRPRLNLPGGYNIYNAAAAAAASVAKGLPGVIIVDAIERFKSSFGRAEKFIIGGSVIRLMLVKNPSGFNQVLSFIANADIKAILVLALNDRLADGTDISWIWDVDFEMLLRIKGKFSGFYVSGIRADEMALRLKYAGLPENEVHIIRDYDELIAEIIKIGCSVYILPTYTAMFDIRHALSKLLPVKAFYG